MFFAITKISPTCARFLSTGSSFKERYQMLLCVKMKNNAKRTSHISPDSKNILRFRGEQMTKYVKVSSTLHWSLNDGDNKRGLIYIMTSKDHDLVFVLFFIDSMRTIQTPENNNNLNKLKIIW